MRLKLAEAVNDAQARDVASACMISAEQPRLLLVAEPNGAGKTTVTERRLAHELDPKCKSFNVVQPNKRGDGCDVQWQSRG